MADQERTQAGNWELVVRLEERLKALLEKEDEQTQAINALRREITNVNTELAAFKEKMASELSTLKERATIRGAIAGFGSSLLFGLLWFIQRLIDKKGP